MKNDVVEKEFLTILYVNPKIGFDLLQIRPHYLENSVNQIILEGMIKSYEKLKAVDYSFLANYSAKIINDLAHIVSEEYMPVTEIRNRFQYCQMLILENFKKKVILKYSEELKCGKLTNLEYLDKMQKLESIQIYSGGNILTLEELNQNVGADKARIHFNNFKNLDKMLQLVQNDFLVIGASTGAGKSGLLLNFMNDLMGRYQCIYFNMEMSKSTIYERMISINADVPLRYIAKPETDNQASYIEEAKKKIVSNKVIIEHEVSSIEDIQNFIKGMKNEENKHTIIFLDHLGLISADRNTKSLYEQMTSVAKKLRQICLMYDCTIICACQLNRSAYQTDDIELPMLKDSGEIENSSSKVILLYRDKEYSEDNLNPKMILKIAKNRDGMKGKIECMYDKTKQIFSEV